MSRYCFGNRLYNRRCRSGGVGNSAALPLAHSAETDTEVFGRSVSLKAS